MEDDVVELDAILRAERPVTLADVEAVAEFADEFLLELEDEFKNAGYFVVGEVPGFFDMPLGHDEQVAGDFVRIAEHDLGVVVFAQDRLVRIAKWTVCRFGHMQVF